MSKNEQLRDLTASRFNEVLEEPAVQTLIEINQARGIDPEATISKLANFYHGHSSENRDQTYDLHTLDK